MSKRVYRGIVNRSFYTTLNHPRGTSSVFYRLSCGHTQGRKGSQDVKGSVVRCKECEKDAGECDAG